jgi:hypothetical protein
MSKLMDAAVVAILVTMLVAAPGVAAARGHIEEGSIPIRVVQGRFVIVPVAVNGTGPHPFLLDTGSGTSIVAPELARRLRLRGSGASVQETLTVARRTDLVRASLAVGGLEKQDLDVLASPLDAVRDLDAGLAGVLGQDVLRSASWGLDYRAKVLVVRPASPARADREERRAARVPLHWASGRPAVDVVGGGRAMRLVLDSAATSAVLFRDPVASGRARAGWARLTTYLGAATVPLVTLGLVRVGGVSLAAVTAALVADNGDDRPGEDGLLPTALFDRVYFEEGGAAVSFN